MTMLAIESGVRTHVHYSPRPEKSTFSNCVSTQAEEAVHVAPRQNSSKTIDLTNLLPALMDLLQQGIMVVSQQFELIYWSAKAQSICQSLLGAESSQLSFPPEILHVCSRLIKLGAATSPLVVECPEKSGHGIRIKAYWLEPTEVKQGHPLSPIVVLLEDSLERLQEETLLEQKKYGLTDREAEIWMLLRQEYSYQEIAQKLQISLNTVKTHLKNVYAKKRSCLIQPFDISL